MVRYKYSTTFKAPIKYVFNWCTDYRTDDNKITGGKYPRIILEKTKNRVVFASYKQGSDGTPKLAVRVVTLNPSKYSWHLDYFGEEDLETGEYRLKRVGKNVTRLDMEFNNKWKHGKGPALKEHIDHARHAWQKYGPKLESDYAKSR